NVGEEDVLGLGETALEFIEQAHGSVAVGRQLSAFVGSELETTHSRGSRLGDEWGMETLRAEGGKLKADLLLPTAGGPLQGCHCWLAQQCEARTRHRFAEL